MPALGLDTGGTNYYRLYKKLDTKTLSKPLHRYIDTKTMRSIAVISNENTATTIECIDDWVHLMRASNWNDDKNKKASQVEDILLRIKEAL